jgi:two-component system chemotaxis response regulator CheY
MAYNVLICDDSVAMRQMMKMILTAYDYGINEANDGLEALELAKKYQFDLIITDVNMPKMDGLSLVRQLRTLPDYQFTPILLATTEPDGKIKKAAKTAGATGWIIKPFEPDRLVAAVKKVLR